jgi:hypothetical protein
MYRRLCGVGLDFQTVATMVGHYDSGYLIATVYTKLAERRARARAQRAIDAYQQRLPASKEPALTGPRAAIALQKNPVATAIYLQ